MQFQLIKTYRHEGIFFSIEIKCPINIIIPTIMKQMIKSFWNCATTYNLSRYTQTLKLRALLFFTLKSLQLSNYNHTEKRKTLLFENYTYTLTEFLKLFPCPEPILETFHTSYGTPCMKKYISVLISVYSNVV